MAALKFSGKKLGNRPIVLMPFSEFAALPVFDKVPPGQIEKMPLGFRFRFPAGNQLLEVVKFDDVILEQWGASVLYQPSCWVNRYEVVFEPEKASS
jgi:hypothetical protein